MKCEINCFLPWCLSRDDFLLTCCLAMEPFRGVITFQSALLTRVNLRMGYGYALLLLKSLHAHLWNVLKYDYLIIKTKEAISLIWLWKLSLLSNSLCNEGRKKNSHNEDSQQLHTIVCRLGKVMWHWNDWSHLVYAGLRGRTVISIIYEHLKILFGRHSGSVLKTH